MLGRNFLVLFVISALLIIHLSDASPALDKTEAKEEDKEDGGCCCCGYCISCKPQDSGMKLEKQQSMNKTQECMDINLSPEDGKNKQGVQEQCCCCGYCISC